jgi:hypothetical protein
LEGEPDASSLKLNTTLAFREYGRTLFTLPTAAKGFDPQPDPPAMKE